MAKRNRQSILKEKIAQLPKGPGVYLFKDIKGTVLYVGKAKNLRWRVASYFHPTADLGASRSPMITGMIEHVVDIDSIECESEVEAMLGENRLIKDIQPPYNERLTDDKTFPYLEITMEKDFPAVYVTRNPSLRSKLFGPFVNVRGLRAAVQELQRIFKFRTCKLELGETDIKGRHFRPCLLYSINQCSAPCAGKIDRSAYREDIKRLTRFLSSKRSTTVRQMRKEMQKASEDLDFETAGKIRDQIKALEALALSGKPDVDVQPEVFFADPTDGLEKLAKILALDNLPRIIEGFDIATIQGSESCGSLVCFIDGVPFKSGYKRFGIKTVTGIDDYAMLSEVITRRYRRIADHEELFPDLILVDGGKGQLHAALDALEALELTGPKVVALAKKEEEIFTHPRGEPIRLQRTDPAIKLLQYVRDEAHRFAQHYHHILRRKKLLGE